jgi:hypothetical protein
MAIDDVADEGTEVLLAADDDEAVSGEEDLGRFGSDDRFRPAQDRGDGHLRTAPDLQVGDRATDRGRVVEQRDPVDQERADDGFTSRRPEWCTTTQTVPPSIASSS